MDFRLADPLCWPTEGSGQNRHLQPATLLKSPAIHHPALQSTMKMLTVIFVDPPDEEAASITLQSEQGEIVVFCHPCSLKIGDAVENRLSVLDADVCAAYLSDWSEDAKEAVSSEHLDRIGQYAYRGRGRVIDSTEGLVEVQGFVIEMGARYEGYVDFEITRLDFNP
jgi:hypothetical protein